MIINYQFLLIELIVFFTLFDKFKSHPFLSTSRRLSSNMNNYLHRSNYVNIGDYYRNYRYFIPNQYVRQTIPLSSTLIQDRSFFDGIFHPPPAHHHSLAPHHHFGVERSDFLYVLPILLVIGLGAFLIPIITTFFITLITSQGSYCGRRKRSLTNNHHDSLNDNITHLWTLFEQAVRSKWLNNSNNKNQFT